MPITEQFLERFRKKYPGMGFDTQTFYDELDTYTDGYVDALSWMLDSYKEVKRQPTGDNRVDRAIAEANSATEKIQ